MHWKHSRFDTTYLILGNCHTYDEAYRILCELEEDRTLSIDSSLAESLRAQSKVVGAKVILSDSKETQVNKLTAESFVLETEARKNIAQKCLDEARRELDYIAELKLIIKDRRMYKAMENHIAFQLIQPLEWKLDIIWQIYNCMCSTGLISSELYTLAKTHPDSKLVMKAVNILKSQYEQDSSNFITLSKFEVFANVVSEKELPYLLELNDLRSISKISVEKELPSNEV